ncbi:MAG TPA: hypothetical protein VGF25_19235 [Thermoleophilaceae bacterium]
MRRVLLLTLLTAAASSGQAVAATLHVDDLAGASSATCGTPADPCHRIQDAVVRARGAAFPGGDRIQVAPGSYQEEVDLTSAADTGDVIAGAGSGGLFPTAIVSTTGGTGAVVDMGLAGLPEPSALTLQDVRITVNTPAAQTEDRAAVQMSGPKGVLSHVAVNASIPENEYPAIAVNDESQVIEHATIGGLFAGEAVGTFAPSDAAVTVRDSSLTAGEAAGGIRSALSLALGTTARVERSLLRRVQPTQSVAGGQASSLVIDSSLVTGGADAVLMNGPAPQSLTIRNSTIDAGAPGAGATGDDVTVVAAGSTAVIDSSILLEEQTAALPGAAITCSNSDMPDQVQAADQFHGSIDCPSRPGNARGNSLSSPASLFADLAAGDYHLAPGSPAVDSGSPAPLVAGESATDRDGNSRVQDGDHDCVPRRDKGAYEVAAQPVPCPVPLPGAGPAVDTAPIITGLRMSHRRFRVAPRHKRARGSRRAPAGTRFRYRLSEAALVRFAIKRRAKGDHWIPVAKFDKQGTAGAGTKRWSGRVGKRHRALRPGRYRASLQARDGAGQLSKRVAIKFRIVN